MTKYLDQNGLAYFWTKIKAWLSSHAPVKYFGQNWVEDTNNDYALVVGDGADENNPENVFVIKNSGVLSKNISTYDPATPSQSNRWFPLIEQVDINGDTRNVLSATDFATGTQGMKLYTIRELNGTPVNHGINIVIRSTGERYVEFDEKRPWQNALSPWKESFNIADTYDDVDFTKANNNVSANKYPNVIITDKNGLIGLRLENVVLTDGKVGFYLYGQNFASDGTSLPTRVGIKGLINKSGVAEYSIDNLDKFRKALGLGTDGVLPLTIAQGGSGQTGLYRTDVISNILTAGSGITINGAAAIKWGKVAAFWISFKRSSTISIPANGNINNFSVGKLKSGWWPKLNQSIFQNAIDADSGISGVISTFDGNISIAGFEGTGVARSIGANTTIEIQAVYLLA